ncbi:SusC/RagA family TonB-linked outer membrane protein [Parachryseolinea silvisoli]|uniref:SusC/RagA family TonB-linked outer membrane protein n=1 Tax=Parachryseolinea silvisoli TaxID=2873601 RepID=UPI002265D329|nr:TonB-dependent receptor [Parachryseolinea silvisoli]MCD9018961.1 TonB-dependent receptor [Parachryseolinea silvisoli]
MRNKYWLLFLATFTGIVCSYAQTTLRGTVRSEQNESLAGVSVYIRGTSTGTFTDATGAFVIALPAGLQDSTLVFSLVGYATNEVVIGSRTQFEVVLADDTRTLSEVVVTGYMVEERQKITGAVNTVAGDLIGRLPVPGIDQALQGRAPGVVVSQNTGAPGEGVSVRIRGTGSINSSNSPLYIVDGVPTMDISALSSQDVENISVLKDAGAASVYGSRATNGVVIITTKAGTSKDARIQVSSQVGFQEPSRLIDMANTRDYVTLYNEAATNDNATKTNPLFFRKLIPEEMVATLPDVDQVDAIMRKGVIQSHSISASGKDGKTSYFLSGNYFGQEGIIKGSDYDRISGRINLNTEVKSWLRTGVNINLSKEKTDIIGSSGDGAGGNGGSVIRYAFFRTPAISIYDANGDFVDKPDDFQFFGDGYNPVGMVAYNNNERLINRLFGKFFVEIDLLKDLKFTSNVGVDYSKQNQRRFDRTWGTGDRINGINQLSVSDQRNQTMTYSNFLTYSRTLGIHNLSILLGAESIKRDNYYLNASEKDFPDQNSNLVYLGNGLGQRVNSEGQTGSALQSFFGKVNYDYADKYLASVTLRRDGSSRFGPDNRWGNFYAGSLGWRMDKESFLENSDLIDRLLWRVSYGKVGNQEINDYPFTDMITSGYNYPFGNVYQNGYATSVLGNSGVKWEASEQLNAGVDVEIWEGELAVSLDYFRKITSDLLVSQPIASSAGTASAPVVNNGKILNRGFELAVSYRNSVGGLHYSISANAATLYNEILAMDPPIRRGQIGSDYLIYNEVGHSVGSFYLYQTEGIFQDKTQIFTHAYQGATIQPGDVMYKDQDGSNTIDPDDRRHAGSAIPQVTAGLNVALNYKQWDFSLFFQGAYGQKIYSVLNRDIEGFYRAFNVTQRYVDHRWTGPGSTNEYPRASWDASGNNASVFSDRFLEDGSYTRLKNLQLGYTVPAAVAGKIGLSSVRIYVSGTNLLTFTGYQGLDPEMTTSDNAKGQGDSSAGMDWGTYPSARSYNLGVKLSF